MVLKYIPDTTANTDRIISQTNKNFPLGLNAIGNKRKLKSSVINISVQTYEGRLKTNTLNMLWKVKEDFQSITRETLNVFL